MQEEGGEGEEERALLSRATCSNERTFRGSVTMNGQNMRAFIIPDREMDRENGIEPPREEGGEGGDLTRS